MPASWWLSAAASGLLGAAAWRYVATYNLARDRALLQPPPRAWAECVKLGGGSYDDGAPVVRPKRNPPRC